MPHTLLRPHWRPTHDATPHGFDRWLAPDGELAWVKIVNPDGHLCRQVWNVAPQAKICLRLHAMSEEKTEMMADPVGTAQRHTELWADFVAAQGLSDRLDDLAFEGINEPNWEPPNLPPVVAYNAAFVERMAARYMMPTALQMNTGWPTNHGIHDAPPDWAPFEPVRQALLAYGGYLSVHEYCDRRGPASDDWLWNMGRIFQIPDSWVSIPVLVTECGYDQAVNAPHGTPNHGWQGHLSADEYMAFLTEYDRRMRYAVVDYPTKPRVEALFIFTHDFDQPWGTFDTVPLLDRLCGHAEWVRQQPPIQPQPPNPQPPNPQPPQPAKIVHPLPSARITQHWGENAENYARYGIWGHNGTDFGARLGTPLYAMAAGVVAWADVDPDGYGLYVRVWHEHLQCHSFYAHLDKHAVSQGQVVTAGQVIGYVGSTGNSTGPHLHLEIRLAYGDGSYSVLSPMPKGRCDPETWFCLRRVKL